MAETASEASPPTNESEFQELMELIDQTIRDRHVPVHAREMAGLSELSRLLRVEQYPMDARSIEPRPGVYTGADLTARAIRWFDERYGERLRSFDPRPGRMALLLRGDLWVFHFPLLMGQHDVVASRTIKSTQGSSRAGIDPVPVYNIVDALDGMTASMKASLTDVELKDLMHAFGCGITAYLLARSLRDRPFVPEAITDHEAAVSFLAGTDRHLGQARWSALQAAEKMLKSCIDLSGHTPPRTHQLKELAEIADLRSGLTLDPGLLSAIQVSPDVRYEQRGSQLEESILAHQSSLELTRITAAHMRQSLGRSGIDVTSVRPSY